MRLEIIPNFTLKRLLFKIMGFKPVKIFSSTFKLGLLVLLVFLNNSVSYADSISYGGNSVTQMLNRAKEMEDSDIYSSIELLSRANKLEETKRKKY